MGFGTGHHATTRLTLMALQALPVDGRTVLDIGCGSGVLAIAAIRLGARSAVGVDVDPDAVANATENLDLNGLSGRVRVEVGDFRVVSSPAHIVMANLTGGLLQRSALRLAELVEPGGSLIVSGFMTSERESVLEALQASLRLQRTAHDDEWMCAVLDRPPA
jgi:ribosomal protein L11 methyltransferase